MSLISKWLADKLGGVADVPTCAGSTSIDNHWASRWPNLTVVSALSSNFQFFRRIETEDQTVQSLRSASHGRWGCKARVGFRGVTSVFPEIISFSNCMKPGKEVFCGNKRLYVFVPCFFPTGYVPQDKFLSHGNHSAGCLWSGSLNVLTVVIEIHLLDSVSHANLPIMCAVFSEWHLFLCRVAVDLTIYILLAANHSMAPVSMQSSFREYHIFHLNVSRIPLTLKKYMEIYIYKPHQAIGCQYLGCEMRCVLYG